MGWCVVNRFEKYALVDLALRVVQLVASRIRALIYPAVLARQKWELSRNEVVMFAELLPAFSASI